jgi:hypothetical protein
MSASSARRSKNANNGLRVEMDHFNHVEPGLIKKGLLGCYVVIHDRKILAEGKTLDDAIRKLSASFTKPPEPLLIRQILGRRRVPIRMRSPKRAAGDVR